MWFTLARDLSFQNKGSQLNQKWRENRQHTNSSPYTCSTTLPLQEKWPCTQPLVKYCRCFISLFLKTDYIKEIMLFPSNYLRLSFFHLGSLELVIWTLKTHSVYNRLSYINDFVHIIDHLHCLVSVFKHKINPFLIQLPLVNLF